MTDTPDEARVTVTFSISGAMPLSGKFMRDRPAADEGPAKAWELAQQVIDHGAYILDTVNSVAEGRQVRDMVLAALLRRALIMAEGVRRCLFHGLEEPAIVLLRTLLEVELNMRLVTQDATDQMARRLAAYHFLKTKRHITNVLEHPDVRAGDEDFKTFMRGAGRRQKEYFNAAAFDDIRNELAASQHWHGHRSIESAFESIGGDTDYLHLYDSLSPFVHAANLDFDFTEIVDDKPHMRPLTQRDPKPIQHYLQGGTLILLRILQVYLEDKGAESYAAPFTVTFESGDTEEISPLNALQQYAIAVWGAGDGWQLESDEGDGEIVPSSLGVEPDSA